LAIETLRIYLSIVAFIAGASLASFANCFAYRGARGQSAMRGRSACPACGHRLSALDLIPILSYALIEGRCRYCREKISPRYILTELTGGLYFISVLLVFGLSPETIAYMAAGVVLLIIALWDLDSMIIPDRCIIALIAIYIGLSISLGGGLSAIATRLLLGLGSGLLASIPILILVLIMDRLLKKESMGGGDIKLLFALGLYLEPATVLLLIAVSSFIGIFFGLAMKRRSKEQAFPFGPAICLAFWPVLLWGKSAVDAYLALFAL